MKEYTFTKIVNSEDLSHHRTLFAGRMAEWFTEACMVAATALYGNPEDLVCIKIHGLKFEKPIKKGEILQILTKVVSVGTTSIHVYGKVIGLNNKESIMDGFVTFVTVDSYGAKKAHRLEQPEPIDREEQRLVDIVKALK